MEKSKKFSFSNVLKGALVSVLISLGLILVFAVLLKFVELSDIAIKLINQTIKIISIFFGVYMCQKHQKEQGLITGLIIGLIYSFIAYFVFSLLNCKITFGLSNILDLLFSGIFGAICGIFCANFRTEERIN